MTRYWYALDYRWPLHRSDRREFRIRLRAAGVPIAFMRIEDARKARDALPDDLKIDACVEICSPLNRPLLR